MDTASVTYGDSYTLPECGFARDGNKFVGWATKADGEVITDETVKVTGDVTLFAVWKEVKTVELKVAALPLNKFSNGKYANYKDAINEYLSQIDADVITFSLVDVNCRDSKGNLMWNKTDMVKVLTDVLGEKYPYHEFAKVWYTYNDPANADPNSNDGWVGHMVFSKYEITHFETLIQEDGGANGEDYPNKDEDRGAGCATIKVGDATVDVFVMANGGAGHWNGALANAIKNSTADAWIATGNTHCRAGSVATIEGYLGQKLSYALPAGVGDYYITGGSNIAWEDATIFDCYAPGWNYYKWYFATAVITY